MGKARRVLYNGAIYHVMSRGNRRKTIFNDDDDRLRFLEILGEAQQRYHLRWRAFNLMHTHYHAEVETPLANLPEGMRHVNGQYAKSWNRRRGVKGHLFEGPYVAKVIEDDRYAYTALKYIAWNPVEAGYVTHPSDWTWSSCRATAGLTPAPEFLDLGWLQGFFGGRTLEDAQRHYREFIEEPLSRAESEDYVNAVVIGSEDFREAIRRQIGLTMSDVIVPRIYRALARPSLLDIFGECRGDLERRNLMIRRAQVVHGYRQYEIARSLNLHPNTVSKIVSGMKKQRFFLVEMK